MAEGDAAQPQQRQQQGGLQGILGKMVNMFIMYWLMTSGVQMLTGNKGTSSSSTPTTGGAASDPITSFFGSGGVANTGSGPLAETAGLPKMKGDYMAATQINSLFKLHVTLTPQQFVPANPVVAETGETATDVSTSGDGYDTASVSDEPLGTWEDISDYKLPSVSLSNLPFSLEDPQREMMVELNLTRCQELNCTIRADVVYTSMGDKKIRVNYSVPLVTFSTEKNRHQRNLFDEAPTEEEIAERNDTTTRTYFQPTLTVNPVVDVTRFSDPMPDPLGDYIRPIVSTCEEYGERTDDPNSMKRYCKYYPIVYDNDFWVLKDHLHELNATSCAANATLFNLTVIHYPLSMWKFMLYSQMQRSFNMHQSAGMMMKREQDETKRIFLETNPYFLGLTMAVSLLHLAFEYLAFSNDVSFWKNKKNFKGLSLRTVALNCYFQTIIFLYLMDGETSWQVVIPSGIGVLIEYWKLRKVVAVSRDERGKWKFEFKSSYDDKTRSYDQQAMTYLTYLLIPCLIGYSVYSAVYHEHKGWYSFLIATQVRFIYFSGFIMMTPQIFINYKLKTVSHLPWRTFVYKALNTFIDDLFAFIIKMPTMHRLACFRDDLIFFILLYQRWIYKVDKSRTEDGDDIEETKEVEGHDEKKAIEASPSAAEAEKPEEEKKND